MVKKDSWLSAIRTDMYRALRDKGATVSQARKITTKQMKSIKKDYYAKFSKKK